MPESPTPTHLTDDDLDQVALGGPASHVVRHHLDICESCRERVDDRRAFIQTMGDLVRNGVARKPSRLELDASRNGSPSGGAEYADDDSGRIIGDYELLAKIGRGSQGDVYRARQVHTGKEVALKRVKPGGRRYAMRELATAINLEHEHLVRIYHVGEDAGQLYFTMKLAENGSLDKRIEEYRLPDTPAIAAAERRALDESKQRICRLMTRIARAVHYLHDRGTIHRDLKPGNILLDSSGEPHVTDLGIARQVLNEANESTGIQPSALAQAVVSDTAIGCGTPGYIAPEQMHDPPDLGRTVDVYALGAILYELLARRRPFEGTEDEILEQTAKVNCPAPRPSLYNPNLQEGSDLELICLKCLAKMPPDRYASASELADDLELYAQGEETSVRPRGPLERITRPIVQAVNHKLPLPGIARWGAIDFWDAGLNLAVNAALFALIRTDCSPAMLWFAWLTYYAVWWWMFLTYLYRRDRIDPTERHLALLWGGVFLAGITLFWIDCPPLGSHRAADLLAFYPPWTVVNGVAFLVVGRIYWGVYYLVGLAHFLVAALMPLRPDLSPLVYGVFVALCMSFSALDHLRAARRENARS
jgi:serine/threonine protein kinase